jgi:predicted ribonuclease YlaK
MQNNDSRIIATVYHLVIMEGYEFIFLTSDLNCYEIAYSLKLDCFFLSDDEKQKYKGFKEVEVNDEELAKFYEHQLKDPSNIYDLYVNEYLLLKYNNKITDMYKWDGQKYQPIPFMKFESKMFGKIMPKGNDSYQQIAMDSLATNQITMLRGRAGTGKSLLSFGYMFSLLDQQKIDKIIIFCNTVATKGSAKLGYYPGSRTEKLLDSQIGNFLISKLGDRIAVERLIADGQLVLLPMSDIRGFDTTDMHAAVYITEAQNLDKELMKLALQRIGEDCICILDGDSDAQVDLGMYAGNNNGMKRVSKVYRGASFYGEVELQNIYRSRIAELAEKM